MRKSWLVWALFVLGIASPVCAQEYSIREVGFVEVEAKPYRIILMATDVNAPAVKKLQAQLASKMADSNIVLVAQSADATTLTPDKKPIANLGVPQFWLIAPDDRVLPFNPTITMGDLLQSPQRQNIMRETANALCAVVLLESKDDDANAIAKSKAEAAIAKINRRRHQLHHTPDGEVKLLVLSIAQRPRERWTLWGLGEDVSATDEPKIAVLFGKLRRAGALFEGTEWKEDDLFGRIAALGHVCEDELDRKAYFGTPLPFQWSKEWTGQLAHDLSFDPQDENVKAKAAEILQRPARADDERGPRKLTPEQFDHAQQVPAPIAPNDAHGGVLAAMPAVLASNLAGVVVFAIGLAGWIALGLLVWWVERGQPNDANP